MGQNKGFSAFERDCTLHKTGKGEVMLICQLEAIISLSVQTANLKPNGRKNSIDQCEENVGEEADLAFSSNLLTNLYEDVVFQGLNTHATYANFSKSCRYLSDKTPLLILSS